MPIAPATLSDYLEFLPLFPLEDEDAILNRMIAWANEGLDQANPGETWIDTREGGHWRTCVMPGVREIARLYDLAGTETVMAGMVLWTWGIYLDDQAAVQQLTRLPATQALGTVVFTGPEGTPIPAGTQVAVNPAQPDDPAPLFQVTAGADIPPPVAPATLGVLELPIVAVEAGAAGNVGADAITSPSTPVPSGVTFTNPSPTTGGTDVETDEHLRARLLDQFIGQGGGNILDYKRWAEEEPGVGHATIVPLWNGPGTVLVLIATPAGEPVSSSIILDLQERLDPLVGQGQGHGLAPVGHTVTVGTATVLLLEIAATVSFEPGYSLDGTAATIARRQAIVDAITAYVESIGPGGEVVIAQIEGRIATILGVHDVTALTVNGGAVNIVLDTGATAQVAVVDTITLTAA